jgi:hypothetical protein
MPHPRAPKDSSGGTENLSIERGDLIHELGQGQARGASLERN